MRKKTIALALALALVLGITAQAAQPWAVVGKPSLSFSGTTAYCSGSARADNTNDTVVVIAQLYHGGEVLGTWKSTGKGYAKASGTAKVTSGKSYTLTVDVMINGVGQPRNMVTSTCP